MTIPTIDGPEFWFLVIAGAIVLFGGLHVVIGLFWDRRES
jgi:hypothetical protein